MLLGALAEGWVPCSRFLCHQVLSRAGKHQDAAGSLGRALECLPVNKELVLCLCSLLGLDSSSSSCAVVNANQRLGAHHEPSLMLLCCFSCHAASTTPGWGCWFVSHLQSVLSKASPLLLSVSWCNGQVVQLASLRNKIPPKGTWMSFRSGTV